MPELIAISFPDEILAGQAAAELERRSGDLSLDPDAIGVSICERDGTSQLLTSHQPGSTAAWRMARSAISFTSVWFMRPMVQPVSS